jgi:probable rRNA maturation factor
MYVIELQHETDITGIDTLALERLASRALELEHVATPAELSIMLADDPTVRELNREYRSTDAETDVLSFAQSDGDPFTQPDGTAPHLGDVIISVDTARRQAAEAGIALEDEVSHLVVHGILHLLGYDHGVAAEAAIMQAHEDAILGAAAHHH